MVETLLSRFGYLAIFGLLAGAGTGVPIPEEPILLLGGALAQRGTLSLVAVLAVSWSAIVSGDLLWFHIAQRLGPRVLERRPVRRVLTPQRRIWLEAHLARHGFLTVLVSRHLSGLRLPAFALAATHGVRWKTFLLADGLSALLSVPTMVAAGYYGGRHLEGIRADLRRVELGVLLVVLLAVTAWFVIRHLRRARAASLAAATPHAEE